MDERQQPLKEEKKQIAVELEANATDTAPPPATGGGGWGGWGFSPLSLLSDLQKAAAAAAEEISRNVCLNLIIAFNLFIHSGFASSCNLEVD